MNADEDWGHIKLAPGESKDYTKSIHREADFDEIKVRLNDLSILKMPEQ